MLHSSVATVVCLFWSWLNTDSDKSSVDPESCLVTVLIEFDTLLWKKKKMPKMDMERLWLQMLFS